MVELSNWPEQTQEPEDRGPGKGGSHLSQHPKKRKYVTTAPFQMEGLPSEQSLTSVGIISSQLLLLAQISMSVMASDTSL